MRMNSARLLPAPCRPVTCAALPQKWRPRSSATSKSQATTCALDGAAKSAAASVHAAAYRRVFQFTCTWSPSVRRLSLRVIREDDTSVPDQPDGVLRQRHDPVETREIRAEVLCAADALSGPR